MEKESRRSDCGSMSEASVKIGCREERLQEEKPSLGTPSSSLYLSAGSFYTGFAWFNWRRKGKQKYGDTKSMDIVSKSIKCCLILAVLGYRIAVRPWISSCCKYEPTCSEYALLCLDQFPVHTAVVKILRRLIFCNPFSKGGVDYPNH